MNVFISGGCKNGKSYYAQHVAKDLADSAESPLYYIATMIPRDEEDRARISRHLKEREGWGFETIEQGKNLPEILDRSEVNLSGVFMLDSVTAIMENEMFGRGDVITTDEDAPARVRAQMVDFAKVIKAKGGSIVFVSDGIYGDMGEYSRSTESYRKALAGADLALAEVCDRVIEITYGIETVWKAE